ncbi:RNI-like protein [Pyrenochaeta sp. DS3sAY3a]|nr:RNI-like protein [Pyrenochaeta sp. DS3sAY3a]
MALATKISKIHGLQPSVALSYATPKPSPSRLATYWAAKLQQQTSLIASYAEIEDVPIEARIDESVLDAPRRRAADPEAAQLAQDIAQIMFPSATSNSLFPIIQYEKDLQRLRKLVLVQRKRTIEENTKRNESVTWGPRIMKQGPWNPITDPTSLTGAASLPMPVQIANPETLAPFFKHLALGGNESKGSTLSGVEEAVEMKEPAYDTASLEFEKGVLYSDNRMDLCKMVLGPNNIAALMESLKTNEFVTHFLLGNNIIGPHGAKCIAEFLKDYPNRMDTWYLAGNCIDAASFGLLVDEWVKSTSVTNIWLKRNPLGLHAADDLVRLVTQTRNLRTLDLDQTELGDEGVSRFFTSLAQWDKPVALRHIYLNGTGIGVKAATAIAGYLASPHCALDSLYASNNPIGSDGLVALAVGLKKNKSMSRVALASVGASDEGVIALCSSLEKNLKLITLDIGQSYATEDLGTRYNWITDRSAFAIHNLVSSSPQLAHLNIAQCAMTHLGLTTILEAVVESPTLLFYRASTIWPQSRESAAINAGQKHAKLVETAHTVLLKNVQNVYGKDTSYDEFMTEHKRWLVNDKTDVRKIDSVYRNRDAQLARRGLKKLDKWWNEGDQTLKEVMGAVGPVCTLRKQKAYVGGAVGPTCAMKT